MFEILKLYGIPNTIILAILYTDTSSTILASEGEMPPFLINAPFLFIIAVDYVLRMSINTTRAKDTKEKPRRSTRHPAQYLTDTDFADDIVLISELENAITIVIL